MNEYEVKVTVEYEYTVEADSWEAAEQMGWKYEDYPYAASVYSIDVTEIEPDEDEEEESDDDEL